MIHDAYIKSEIKQKLTQNDRSNAAGIDVEVVEGVVLLTGIVTSFADFRAAMDAAVSCEGVMGVDNELLVASPDALDMSDNKQLPAIIENMLEWDVNIDASNIKAEVDNATVILKGTVQERGDRIRAEAKVRDLYEEVTIKNKLAVVPTHKMSDTMIARNISNALDRNLAVNINAVDVQVENRQATLSGVVGSPSVESAAYTTVLHSFGVKKVDNQLKV